VYTVGLWGEVGEGFYISQIFSRSQYMYRKG
jgi:hypothetical protein